MHQLSIDARSAIAPPPAWQAMARWFCGVPSVWELFSAPLIPERCYFSATITRSELEHRGVEVFGSESACRLAMCVVAPRRVPGCWALQL